MKNHFFGAFSKKVFAPSNCFCKHEVTSAYEYFASSFFYDEKNNLTKAQNESVEMFTLMNLLTKMKVNDTI
jgi:hypothetical protein